MMEVFISYKVDSSGKYMLQSRELSTIDSYTWYKIIDKQIDSNN